MAFCPNCGASVEGRFCAKCGAAVSADAAPLPGAQPYQSSPAAAGGLTDNVAGALCYALGLFTGIVFLALAPYNQNRLIRFHAFQSIFFHLAWVVFWMVETAISMMLPFGLGVITGLLSLLVFLSGLLIWLLLMWKTYKNEKFKLPVIGDLAEKQA